MKAAIQIIRDADRGQLLTDMQLALDDIANAIERNGGGVGEIKLLAKAFNEMSVSLAESQRSLEAQNDE